MEKIQSKILFIYNADSGFTNALIDQGIKYLTPDKYECKLCMVSYGPVGMRKDWKRFIKDLPYNVEFLHRDELQNAYPRINTSLPAVVLVSSGKTRVLLKKEDFDHISSVDGLKSAVLASLEM